MAPRGHVFTIVKVTLLLRNYCETVSLKHGQIEKYPRKRPISSSHKTKRPSLYLTSLAMSLGDCSTLYTPLLYLLTMLFTCRSYALQVDPSSLVSKPKEKLPPSVKRESVLSHDNELGDLVLGHASMITAMQLSLDDRFIITSDRDEHIRVSQYPDGFNIERFCLGHTKYVQSLSYFSPT